MAKAIRVPSPMTVEGFVDWAMARPEGRYELVEGKVVAMAPERIAHARLKAEVWLALQDAIAAEKLPCEALLDGAGVQIDARTLYIPDALVYCGERLTGDQLLAVIVVEILSATSIPAASSRAISDWQASVTI